MLNCCLDPVASKRRALKASNDALASSLEEFDSSKFVSQKAFKRYMKIVPLKFIIEKGFVKPSGILRREIGLKRWIGLCKYLETVMALIVREF